MTTPTDDTLARARERLAALRAAEGAATPGPWIDAGDGEALGDGGEGGYVFFHAVDADMDAIVALRNAAPALLDLADAVARLTVAPGATRATPWWLYASVSAHWMCSGCGRELDGLTDRGGAHAPDCPALAIDAALARLAGEA